MTTKPRQSKKESKRADDLAFLLKKGLLDPSEVPLYDSNDINCRCVPPSLGDDPESKKYLMAFLKHIGDGLYERYTKHPEELNRLNTWPCGYQYAVPHAEKYVVLMQGWGQRNQEVISRYLMATPSKYSGKPPLLIAIEGFTYTHHITSYRQYKEMWDMYDKRRFELYRHLVMEEQCVLYPFYTLDNWRVRLAVWLHGGRR